MHLYNSLKFLTIFNRIQLDLKSRRFEKINKIINNILINSFIKIR